MLELRTQFQAAYERVDLADLKRLGQELELELTQRLQNTLSAKDRATTRTFWRGELGRSYLKKDRPELAAPLFRSGLAIADEGLSPLSTSSRMFSSDLLKAVETWEDAEETQTLRQRATFYELDAQLDRILDTSDTLGNSVPLTAQDFAKAEPIAKQVVEFAERLFPKDPALVANGYKTLAKIHHGQRQYDQADACHSRILKLAKEAEADERRKHWAYETLGKVYYTLAWQCEDRKQEALGEQWLLEAVRLLELAFLADKTSAEALLDPLQSLAGLRRFQGNLLAAESVYRRWLEVWEARKEQFGRKGAEGVAFRADFDVNHSLAFICSAQGKYLDAERFNQAALKMLRRLLGFTTFRDATEFDEYNLELDIVRVCSYQGKLAEAEAHLDRLQKRLEAKFGRGDIHAALILDDIAKVCLEQGRGLDAELQLRRAVAVKEGKFGFSDAYVVASIHELAKFYIGAKRYSEAAELSHKVLAYFRPQVRSTPRNRAMAESFLNLASIEMEQLDYANAQKAPCRGVAIRHPDSRVIWTGTDRQAPAGDRQHCHRRVRPSGRCAENTHHGCGLRKLQQV